MASSFPTWRLFSLASVRWLAPACVAAAGEAGSLFTSGVGLVVGFMVALHPVGKGLSLSSWSMQHERVSCLGLVTTASVSHCAGRPLCHLNYCHCGARLVPDLISVCSSQERREQVPPQTPRRAGPPLRRPRAMLLTLSLCVNSRIPIPPNTQLLPTAPTPAARQAPPPPTGASSPLKAWSRRPTTPEATGHHLVTTGPGAAWLRCQCQD